MLFLVFDLILNIPVNNVSFTCLSGRVFLGWTSTKQELKCLAQRHKAVTPVRFDHTFSLTFPAPKFIFPFKQSTTEPLSYCVSWISRNLSSGVCEQQRHRPACTSAQSDQCLCYSLTKESIISRLATSKFSLNLHFSEIPKRGFLASRPIYASSSWCHRLAYDLWL